MIRCEKQKKKYKLLYERIDREEGFDDYPGECFIKSTTKWMCRKIDNKLTDMKEHIQLGSKPKHILNLYSTHFLFHLRSVLISLMMKI